MALHRIETLLCSAKELCERYFYNEELRCITFRKTVPDWNGRAVVVTIEEIACGYRTNVSPVDEIVVKESALVETLKLMALINGKSSGDCRFDYDFNLRTISVVNNFFVTELGMLTNEFVESQLDEALEFLTRYYDALSDVASAKPESERLPLTLATDVSLPPRQASENACTARPSAALTKGFRTSLALFFQVVIRGLVPDAEFDYANETVKYSFQAGEDDFYRYAVAVTIESDGFSISMEHQRKEESANSDFKPSEKIFEAIARTNCQTQDELSSYVRIIYDFENKVWKGKLRFACDPNKLFASGYLGLAIRLILRRVIAVTKNLDDASRGIVDPDDDMSSGLSEREKNAIAAAVDFHRIGMPGLPSRLDRRSRYRNMFSSTPDDGYDGFLKGKTTKDGYDGYLHNDDEEETISCDDEAEESRDEEERQNEADDKNEADDRDVADDRDKANDNGAGETVAEESSQGNPLSSIRQILYRALMAASRREKETGDEDAKDKREEEEPNAKERDEKKNDKEDEKKNGKGDGNEDEEDDEER